MRNQMTQAGHCATSLFIFLRGLIGINIIALLFLPFVAPHYPVYTLMIIVLSVTILCTLLLCWRREAGQRRDLQEQNQQLTERNQFHERLLLMVDHELRTPLSGAKGYLELLLMFSDKLTETEKANYLAQVGKACEEVGLLANALSDSLWLNGRQEISTKKVALNELIQTDITMLTPRIQKEQREVIVSSESNAYVLADPLRLRQVLSNLLTNAMNYSPTGTPIEILNTRYRPASYPLAETPAKPQVYIAIKDQGIGIPPDQQALLFEPFVRLPTAREMYARGTGLGLFLCKQLLTAMGGYIWIESAGTKGKGTTMWISLLEAQ